MNDITIGETLRLLRNRAGYSQRKLAAKSMICHVSIYRYENDLADPPYSVVQDLLKAMGYRLEIVKDESNTYTGDPVRID